MPGPVLETLEEYYDAVPRWEADVEELGPFTLFVSRGAWPNYARPSRSYIGPTATAGDVAGVLSRQVVLGVPESFEWVDDVSPGLGTPMRAAGLVVNQYPLQLLTSPVDPPGPDRTARVRVVPADDPDLPRIWATVGLGFASPGTAVGPAGTVDRDRAAASSAPDLPWLRRRLAEGTTVLVVAEDDDGPLGAGSHQPVGTVTEVVGVATLPAARRRGIGAAVTARLVAEARARGVTTVFLSADSESVARVYQRLGFRRIGTACVADRASPTSTSAPRSTTL